MRLKGSGQKDDALGTLVSHPSFSLRDPSSTFPCQTPTASRRVSEAEPQTSKPKALILDDIINLTSKPNRERCRCDCRFGRGRNHARCRVEEQCRAERIFSRYIRCSNLAACADAVEYIYEKGECWQISLKEADSPDDEPFLVI